MSQDTILLFCQQMLGLPVGAVPLPACRPVRPYLLEKAHIPGNGTALLFAVPYLVTEDVADPDRNLSVYAVPRDYHLYMKELADSLIPALTDRFPSHRFALFSDHSPIAETEAAARAGLGMLGMNGLLITPVYGSFVFLGEIVTDADFYEATGFPPGSAPDREDPVPRCEACGRCLAACPAVCRDGDRTHCLSSLTQKKGHLTGEEVAMLKAHPLVWGCDTCQLVCPHNQRVIRNGTDTPIPFFREKRMTHIRQNTLSAMPDDEFASRAYSWRGRAVLERNLSLLESPAAGDTHGMTGEGAHDRKKPDGGGHAADRKGRKLP